MKEICFFDSCCSVMLHDVVTSRNAAFNVIGQTEIVDNINYYILYVRQNILLMDVKRVLLL